jgi:hypothetical protein
VRKRIIVTAAAAAAAVASAVPASAVPAKAPTVSDPVVQGLASPLQFDVNRHGIAIAQSGSLTISKVRDNGSLKNLVTEDGNPKNRDVEGVSLTKRGVVYAYSQFKQKRSWLKFVGNGGHTHKIANLHAYEKNQNPDQGNVYGFHHLSQNCASQLPSDFGPPSYTGLVDSHPYAVADAPGRGWYVAEAAGNDILWVSPSGRITTVAVLKGQPATITQDAADANDLPDCTVGKRYFFEPVPTDVEVADGGNLIVSLLPGGPEDPSLGARGKVVRVNPDLGTSKVLASGLAGGTNVAISGAGRIFATNLFGDMISKVTDAGATHYVDITQPAAVEWFAGKLWVSHDVFGPNGSIVTVD